MTKISTTEFLLISYGGFKFSETKLSLYFELLEQKPAGSYVQSPSTYVLMTTLLIECMCLRKAKIY